MKTIQYYIGLACLIVAPFIFSGCSQEDDIEEIFCSGQWFLVNFFTTTNWGSTASHGDKPLITPTQGEKKQITITFNTDGSVTGTLADGTFTANWQGDASTRSVRITNVKANISLNGLNNDFITRLRNVSFYKGDSRTLQLAPEERTSYIQLSHINLNE